MMDDVRSRRSTDWTARRSRRGSHASHRADSESNGFLKGTAASQEWRAIGNRFGGDSINMDHDSIFADGRRSIMENCDAEQERMQRDLRSKVDNQMSAFDDERQRASRSLDVLRQKMLRLEDTMSRRDEQLSTIRLEQELGSDESGRYQHRRHGTSTSSSRASQHRHTLRSRDEDGAYSSARHVTENHGGKEVLQSRSHWTPKPHLYSESHI